MSALTLDAVADLLVQTGSIPAWMCPARQRVKLYVSARRSLAASTRPASRRAREAARLLRDDAARLRRQIAETGDGACLATAFVRALRWEAHRTARALGQPVPRITYADAARAVRAAIRRFVEGETAPVALRRAA